MKRIARLAMAASLTVAAVFLAGIGGEAASAAAVSHPRLAMTPGHMYSGVSCVSASFCVAVGSTDTAGEWTRFNGRRWVPAKPLRHGSGDVSCVSTKFCMTVGGEYAARFNGSGLGKPHRVVSSRFALEGVSCTSRTACRAVAVSSYGGAYVTNYNGASWTKPRRVIAAVDGFAAISCVGAFCVVVDGNAVAVRSGGTWRAHKVSGASQLVSVSCVSSSYCVAADYDGSVALYNGSRWTLRKFANYPYFHGVSCASKSFCLLVGDQGAPQARVLTGTTFHAPYVPNTRAGSNTIDKVDCVSKSFCAVTPGFVEHR
jgi:hypothetical protein